MSHPGQLRGREDSETVHSELLQSPSSILTAPFLPLSGRLPPGALAPLPMLLHLPSAAWIWFPAPPRVFQKALPDCPKLQFPAENSTVPQSSDLMEDGDPRGTPRPNTTTLSYSNIFAEYLANAT